MSARHADNLLEKRRSLELITIYEISKILMFVPGYSQNAARGAQRSFVAHAYAALHDQFGAGEFRRACDWGGGSVAR